MIKSEQLSAFPPGLRNLLNEYGQKDLDLALQWPKLFWGKNIRTWMFTIDGQPIFLAGLTKTSLAGSRAEFWLLWCSGTGKYAKHVLRFLRRALRRIAKIYPKVRLSVEHSFETGKSFARALGFRELPADKYFVNNMFSTFEYRGTY